ncbi:CU044_2847 family protein [Nocardia vaccinii]|uniref:CU044_2847 family protein n=1 Tax=Nocardia vaccinii TaxID=1822 RepID=UPI0008370690|nr:CU044_2847 family protein [Nocardia vaccinii]
METVVFPLEQGGQVLVRAVTDDRYGGVVTRGGGERAEQAVATAQQTFESALGTIRVVAEGVLGQFGLELNAKAGAMVASAGASAQLRVELSWHPR